MQLIIVVSIVIISNESSYAQVTFQREIFFGEGQNYVFKILETEDHGFMAAGWAYSSSPQAGETFLCRMDSVGDTLWVKHYGQNLLSVHPKDLISTSDGSYLVVGEVDSLGSDGDVDIFLLKLNSQGDTLWTMMYGGEFIESGSSVIEVDDGYLIGGQTNSFGSGGNDIYLIKTDFLGTVLWNKVLGSSDDQSVSSIVQTSDNGYILGGDFSVTKLDSVYNVEWSRNYGNVVFH